MRCPKKRIRFITRDKDQFVTRDEITFGECDSHKCMAYNIGIGGRTLLKSEIEKDGE